jgi:vacuolar-type H+-ATPase subunit E/Vma4
MAIGIKTGGREKGTPNKLTKELRENLKNIIDNELNNLSDNLAQLDTKERLEILIKFLPYVLPKVDAINHLNDEPLDLSW